MEATFEPSVSTIRTKMATIEAVELSTIGFLLSVLLMLIPTETPTTIPLAIGLFIIIEGAILGSWAIYLAYIHSDRTVPLIDRSAIDQGIDLLITIVDNGCKIPYG